MFTTRHFGLLVFVALILSGFPKAAYSQCCAIFISKEQELSAYADGADEIFVGTVESGRQLRSSGPLPFPWEYKVRVVSLYRGRRRSTKYVMAQTGAALDVGKPRIICARRNSTGLEMGLCNNGIYYSGAADDALLQKVIGPGTPATAYWLPSLPPQAVILSRVLVALVLVFGFWRYWFVKIYQLRVEHEAKFLKGTSDISS